MPVVRTGETEYEKELAKWEKPYRFEPFPCMVYRAYKGEDTKGAITVLSHDEAIQRKTTRIVQTERELAAALADGWHPDAQQAYDAMAAADQKFADHAAEVNYEVSKMSKKAQADVKRMKDATEHHFVR